MRVPEKLFVQVTWHMGHTAVGCKAMCFFIVVSLCSVLQQSYEAFGRCILWPHSENRWPYQ